MNRRNDDTLCPSRRGFLASAAGVALTGASIATSAATGELPSTVASRQAAERARTEPFWSEHQQGILTPQQTQTYFAAFDLVTSKRQDVVALLKVWTLAAARMSAGQTAQSISRGFAPAVLSGGDASPDASGSYDVPAPITLAADSGEALGLHPARLTVTFGFGAGLFLKDGKDRYGLASQRPEALVDLPRFSGDQLVEERAGGDLSVQACADDPQVAFHAVRQLARLADGVAQIRWAQIGFLPSVHDRGTPRNLMGFRDGTHNPLVNDPKAMAKYVWVGDEGPQWMRRGSYVVFRRIRIALEHWDRVPVAFQEQTIGRTKLGGAPLGKAKESDPMDLAAADQDGNPIIPENSHVRLAAAASNGGSEILRRGYSYNDGVNFTAERWPPWRQGLEYDAGLFFCCYQRDPRTGFIRIYDNMSKLDMLNQFVTHVGGGLFACPPGVVEGAFIGERLFASV